MGRVELAFAIAFFICTVKKAIAVFIDKRIEIKERFYYERRKFKVRHASAACRIRS